VFGSTFDRIDSKRIDTNRIDYDKIVQLVKDKEKSAIKPLK